MHYEYKNVTNQLTRQWQKPITDPVDFKKQMSFNSTLISKVWWNH